MVFKIIVPINEIRINDKLYESKPVICTIKYLVLLLTCLMFLEYFYLCVF